MKYCTLFQMDANKENQICIDSVNIQLLFARFYSSLSTERVHLCCWQSSVPRLQLLITNVLAQLLPGYKRNPQFQMTETEDLSNYSLFLLFKSLLYITLNRYITYICSFSCHTLMFQAIKDSLIKVKRKQDLLHQYLNNDFRRKNMLSKPN